MKKTVKIILLLAIAVLAAGSCKKEIFSRKGEKIHFSAGTSTGTKTTYGPVVSGYQDIKWELGDQIKIAGKNCPIETERQTDTAAVYTVTEVNPEGKGDNYGKIEVATGYGYGLVWGEPDKTHDFYAVFPGTAYVNTFGTIKGSIPAAQDSLGIVGRSAETIIVEPNMDNLYMVAKTTGVASGSKIKIGDEYLFLDFKPLSTALEFTIENGFGLVDGSSTDYKEMIVKSVGLERATHDDAHGRTNVLNGNFTVKMSGPTAAFTGTNDSGRGKVSITFKDDAPIVVKHDQKLNFTFFLNPGNVEDIDDLYFVITFQDNDNPSKTVTRKALMAKTSGRLSFPTSEKTRIKGIVVPESIIITIGNNVIVSPWIDASEIEVNPL